MSTITGTRSGTSLALRNLSKDYGDQLGVDQISLDVAAGEFVTFLGPSGSGKTTTLNMIAGFTDATAGSIDMDDQPIARLKPHQRNIGVVFQHYALFPHMTAAENIAFPLRERKVPSAERERRVAEALELVRLEDFADRYPRQLSGGQQQRVALARALVFGPQVLLMDEPLGALDKKLREFLQLEIKRIHREVGITFVYVTHDQEEALALSDRIAVFNAGRIEQVGTAEELYDRPATLFVADFVGESNRFVGQARAVGSGWTLSCSEFNLQADAAEEVADGQDAVLVVRPEHVRVERPRELNGTVHNQLAGRVAGILFLGSSRKVEVELPSGQRVLAREAVGDWQPVAPGDEALVAFAGEHCRLLPASDHVLNQVAALKELTS